MSAARSGLGPELFEYILAKGVREPDVAIQLREETRTISGSNMQISPVYGAFLKMLVRLTGAKRALEVGVYTGYSSLSVAMALPADGKLIACDVSEEWTSVARRYWQAAGIAHKVDLRLAPALKTLDALIARGQEGTFDFAFIDADKENYEAYFERCLVLVREGGLIAVDNVLWGGSVLNEEDTRESTTAIRAFNEARAADDRVDICLLPIDDGVSLLQKRVAS